MFILLDHSTPAPLRYALKGHVIVETIERGWERLVNGDLLEAAETAGFEVFITADKNIRYQQKFNAPENRHHHPWKRSVAGVAPLR